MFSWDNKIYCELEGWEVERHHVTEAINYRLFNRRLFG